MRHAKDLPTQLRLPHDSVSDLVNRSKRAAIKNACSKHSVFDSVDRRNSISSRPLVKRGRESLACVRREF